MPVRSFEIFNSKQKADLGFFFPDLDEMNDSLQAFFHILYAYIFLFSMKSHFTSKNIRTGHSHKG